jgi:hypothetical protein
MRPDHFRMERDQAFRAGRGRGPAAYEEPAKLPDPIPELGYVYQWIAVSVHGVQYWDDVDKMFRDGWVPVEQAEQPHILVMATGRSPWLRNGCIEIGGCLLCKKAAELVERKIGYYEDFVTARLNNGIELVQSRSSRKFPTFGNRQEESEYGYVAREKRP